MPDLPQDAQFGQLLLQRFREMMQGPDAPQPDSHQILPQTPLTMERDPYHLANHPLLNWLLPKAQSLFSDPSSVLGVAGAVEAPEAAAAKSLVGSGKTYFSNVLDAFSNPKVPNKLTQEQALSVLKAPGVKAEENKWLGMEDFLRGKDKWSKDEIAQYVRDHQIDVHYQVLQGPQPLGPEALEPGWAPPPTEERAKYSNYTLPGGSNYREHLLRWGNKPVPQPDPVTGLYKQSEPGWGANGQLTNWGPYPDPTTRGFESSHFEDYPNVLAHFRTTDRLTPDGKKVLMVEEIQSDWQKALRKQDVAQQDPTQTWDYRASKILHDKGLGEYAPLSKAEIEKPTSDPYRDRRTGLTFLDKAPKVPEAPLARDYLNIATKRIARMAAEEGYDAVGFTTGAQQARRYNQSLLDKVDRLDYNPYSQDLDIWKDGQKIHTMQVPITKLPETVGQEQAEKLLQNMNRNVSLRDNKTGEVLMSGLPSRDAAYDAVAQGKVKSSGQGVKIEGFEPTSSISGKDLKVGERGYSQVYDEQIPRLMDKLGKQFGARTQEGKVSGGYSPSRGFDTHDVHIFPLTPTLRESAKSKGFPLFELGAGATGAGLASQWQRDKDTNYVLH